MRRLRVGLVLGVVLLMLTPSHADAWFGVLDKLSGPGPFLGALFDARLVCFGDQFPGKRILEHLNEIDLELAALKADSKDAAAANRAAMAWKRLADELANVTAGIPRESFGDVARSLKAAPGFTPTDVVQFVQTPRTTRSQKGASPGYGNVEAMERIRATSIDQLTRNMARNSFGVFWSLCGNDKSRRTSIELETDFWYARANDAYANGNGIVLVMLVPSYSWRLTSYLDSGFAAGAYWFSSKGFEAFHGLVLQPARVELHAPADWSTPKTPGWKRFASVFTVRYGVSTFPSGFGVQAFAGTGDKATRLSGELTQSLSLFVSLKPRQNPQSP